MSTPMTDPSPPSNRPPPGAPPANGNGARASGGAPATAQPTPQPTVASVLGELVWLLAQSPGHKHLFLADLEWLIMPPILLNQFRVFHADGKPVGFAIWAKCSAPIEERLATGMTRMQPPDWQSGPALWIVDLVAPFGHVGVMLDDLRKTVFADQEVRYVQRDAAGNATVEVMRGVKLTGEGGAPKA
jgi:cytolysin-activating lysine-acyltransferase